ncbi:MAG: ABC transporter permease, partial [Planctomycetota bacterium]
AIGGVSWLTMSRVVRGQVLSLRGQPFIEATRAVGMGPARVLSRHLLPNLIGVVVVYATLAVPLAILQESFLSFLGIGVRLPLPSWGNLASEGVRELPALTSPETPMHWWLLVFPCLLLGLTLMALNFLGDALRDRFDPKRRGGVR